MSLLKFLKNRKLLILAIFIATIFAIFLFAKNNADAAQLNVRNCPTSCTVDNQPGQCEVAGYNAYNCKVQGQTYTATTASGKVEVKKSGGLWDWIGNIAFSVVFKVFYAITYGIFYFFGLLLSLAGALLDFVLTKPEFNKFALSPIVRTGWDITKNLANMFFALILLVISFATILRIESYGVKQVLPRLIIAALLINFSLVIGGVVIDFSQVLTKYFVDGALKGTDGSSISATIAKKLQVTQGIMATKDESKTPPISESIDGSSAAMGGLFAGIIIILVAAFTFFAAALLFVIRYIALLFLLILAPLAWFFYIVPATRNYWSMWWSTFLKWVFFAPAYAFFLFLSMEIIKSDVMKTVGIDSSGAAGKGFGRYTIPMMINYTIIIGFLIGSLIVAQKFGIWGSGAIINMGRSAGRWGGKQAMRPVKWGAREGGGRVAERVGAFIKDIPGLRKTGRRLEAQGKVIRRTAADEPQHKQYKQLTSNMSDKDVMDEVNSARGVRKLIAAQEAQKRGLDTRATGAAQSMKNVFDSFRMTEESQKLEEKNPHIIDTSTAAGLARLDETIAKVIREGNLNLISHLSVDNKEVAAAISKYASPKQIENLRDRSPQHEIALKTGLDAASTTSATAYAAKVAAGTATAVDTEEDNKIQFAYASQTGDVNRLSLAQAQDWAKKAGPDGLKRIQSFDVTNIKHTTIAENMPASKLVNIVQNINNDQVAKDIVNYIKTTPGASGNHIANNDRYLNNL